MLRRGEIVIAAARGAYTGKPRPCVVVQSDAFGTTDSVTLVPLTSLELEAGLLRLPILTLDGTGLRRATWCMVEKITSVPRMSATVTIGRLATVDQDRLDRALATFLGFA